MSYDVDPTSIVDQYVYKGIRLWMIIALAGALLLTLIIIICCRTKMRIPRTNKEIEIRRLLKERRLNYLKPKIRYQVKFVENEDEEDLQQIMFEETGSKLDVPRLKHPIVTKV